MLKRTALFLALCLTALISHAQNTQITASHIAYFGGTTVTGKFCVTPTNQLGQPITIVTPLGQQMSPQVPLCFPITSGVLSNTAIVPDTSLTQPVNACYAVTINNFFGAQVGVFPCVQPQGTTWSFDAYVPSSLPSIPALTLPQLQLNGVSNPAQGYLDFICPACTVTGGHVTLPTGSLATVSSVGLSAGGTIQVTPSQITTDAFALFNTVRATGPSGCVTLDARALGAATYTVATQLTALSSYCTHLLLAQGTKFTVNTSFATPTNSPASCAVPIGDGSSIIAPGRNTLFGNIIAGSSARVWDLVCNADFTGSQESLVIDGMTIQGNASATVMGSLLHLQGVFVGTRVSNTQTDLCYANCVEIDPGSTHQILSDLIFDGDNFQDSATTGTYPGSVLTINALNSSSGIGNIVFLGGAIQFNGPHNPLITINGQGGVQTQGITFYNVDHELMPATPSSYWTDVNPIQITDASNVFWLSALRLAGTTNPTYQQNGLEISQTLSNNDYGIFIQGFTAYSATGWTCLIKNNVNGDCETGNSNGHGFLVLPPFSFGGGVTPSITQTNSAPSGACVNGSIWTNSTGTTTANTISQCVGNVWVSIGGAVTTSSPLSGTSTISCPTCGVTSNPLSQFAATTSAQLAGIISDETGTGGAVFASGATISPKVLNGKSYSALYPQSDIGDRINHACTDAATRANGNTTGICSADGEAGLAAGVTTHTPIVIGDTSSDAVDLELPAECVFNFFGSSFTGSVASTGITQYSNTKIHSPGGVGQCKFVNNTGISGNMYALYLAQSGTSNAAGTYAKFDGISFQNGSFSTPVTTASTHDMIVQFMTDNAKFENFNIVDYGTGQIPIQIGGNAGSTSSIGSPCCAAMFENLNVNGEYATAGIIQITGNSTNNSAGLVDFVNASLDHPAPGSPVITCTDTLHGVHVAFTHLYSEIEANSSGQVAPAFISGTASTANACAEINVHDQEVKNEGTFSILTNSPIWQTNGTFAGGLRVTGFTAPFSFTKPVTVVQDNTSPGCTSSPCNINSDSSGTLAEYATGGPSVFNSVTTNSLSVGASPPTACGSATGCWSSKEGSTAGTPTAGQDYLRADSTSHTIVQSINGGAEASLPGSVVAVPTPLTAQAANITTPVTIYTTPAANHYYQVCVEADLTRAATTSSTMVSTQIDYTSAVDSAVKVANVAFSPGQTGNATFVSNPGCAVLFVKASTTIQWATVGYASSGATTMQYSLSGTVQLIQ